MELKITKQQYLALKRLKAREPTGSPPWVKIAANIPSGFEVHLVGSMWQQGPVRVISSIDFAKYPRGEAFGPQWHVSAAIEGGLRRPSAVEMLRVRRAFNMLEAEEDNHEPGNARHLFLVCDPALRVACECKEDEVLVTEPDGHQWSNDLDERRCRGCEYEENFGKPCSIHHTAAPRGVVP
jgi:hypothetical protein